MVPPVPISDDVLQRMVNAVERVRQRMLRAAAALQAAGIPYAIAGGNAVAAWVATIDEAAVRNTQDVDVLIRRGDLDRARAALEAAGFVYRKAAGIDLFLDGPAASPRDAVHIIFANEKVRPHEPASNPDVHHAVEMGPVHILDLESLVRIKLTAFRRKDQVHLQDLLAIGLIDQSWTNRLPPALATRLQELIDSPDS
jgi:hypothetical protein